MTKEELDFIGSMNMCDEISNEAYKKIVNHVEETEISDDCVSRQAVLDMAKSYNTDGWDSYTPLVVDVEDIEELPPVTPTHCTCKDCKYCEDIGIKGTFYCKRYGINHLDKYYCADFEKRGNEA